MNSPEDEDLSPTTANTGTVVGFYTKDSLYEHEALRMRRSAELLGLNVQTIPVDPLGSWVRNAGLKAGFLSSMRNALSGSLLYVDVDAVFHADPWPFLNSLDCDLAVHTNKKGELLSGTIFLNETAATSALLEEWVEAVGASPDEWDQVLLDQTIRKSVAEKHLRCLNLPNTFCWITDNRDEKPEGPIMIEHLQASREVNTTKRWFGRIPGKVKRRRKRISVIEKKLWG